VISGLDVLGTRETTTIAPGTIGNDRPLAAAKEFWYSSQLGINLVVNRTDPRAGTENLALPISTSQNPVRNFLIRRATSVLWTPENPPRHRSNFTAVRQFGLVLTPDYVGLLDSWLQVSNGRASPPLSVVRISGQGSFREPGLMAAMPRGVHRRRQGIEPAEEGDDFPGFFVRQHFFTPGSHARDLTPCLTIQSICQSGFRGGDWANWGTRG
jgi:hypothetical protein